MEKKTFFAIRVLGVALLNFILQNDVWPQSVSPKIILEIPPELAKYSYGERRAIIGPSSVDIDYNGDIFIGGGKQILVYNKTGQHLRTIVFSRDFSKKITDIALSKDGRLFILSGSKEIFVIDKNLRDITQDKILISYFLHSTSAFRRI